MVVGLHGLGDTITHKLLTSPRTHPNLMHDLWGPCGAPGLLKCVFRRGETLGFVLTLLLLISMLARTGYCNAGLKSRPLFFDDSHKEYCIWRAWSFSQEFQGAVGGTSEIHASVEPAEELR